MDGQSDSIHVDPRPFDYSILNEEANDFDQYWTGFYPDAIEDIPSNRPGVPKDNPSDTSALQRVGFDNLIITR